MTKRFTDDSARTFDTDESRDDALDSIAPETTAEPGTPEASDDPLDRVLSRTARSGSATVIRDRGADLLGRGAQALGDEAHDQLAEDLELIRMEREDRASLKRVVGLSTELEDVTEVEYRQLRLENVVLIGVYTGSNRNSVEDAENSLRELAALAETAGARVLDGLLQRRATPDPATYLGKGKAQELTELVAAVGADTVIADTELAPSQRRALEDVVKVKVIDRTAVILDIFSQHAKSREGKEPAWDRAAPARPRWSWTGARSTPAWRSCASRSRASHRRAMPSAPTASAARCPRSPSPATRTPASRAC